MLLLACTPIHCPAQLNCAGACTGDAGSLQSAHFCSAENIFGFEHQKSIPKIQRLQKTIEYHNRQAAGGLNTYQPNLLFGAGRDSVRQL